MSVTNIGVSSSLPNRNVMALFNAQLLGSLACAYNRTEAAKPNNKVDPWGIGLMIRLLTAILNSNSLVKFAT